MNLDEVEKFFEGILVGLRARKEIEPLRNKIAELEKEQQSLIKERDDLKSDNDSLIKERDDLKASNDSLREQVENFKQTCAESEKKLGEAEKARQSAEDTAKFYRDTYSELDEAYRIYSQLPDSMRFDLQGIFGAGDTVTGFFSGAVQDSHLEPFWDYVSRHTTEENLIRLFDFCFDMLNSGFREDPYVRLEVAVGNYFDGDTMRRTSQSRQSGNVVRVVLQGYCYSSGNVVKKSIVELG